MAAIVLVLMGVLGADGSSPIPPESRQLVLVLTSGPEETSGTLFRFTRESLESSWKPLGAERPVVLGRRGLASGRGLHRESLPGLPAKKEGDGKSPAGVFRLSSAFGFSEAPAGVGLSYQRVTPELECVDDPQSIHYNRLVDRSSVERPDWSSSERMREIEEYVWGVVVEHNADGTKGEGSCIFLHAWSGPEGATVGCTAMELPRIEEIVLWLRADDSPVLVQLTEDLYRGLRKSWSLPDAQR